MESFREFFIRVIETIFIKNESVFIMYFLYPIKNLFIIIFYKIQPFLCLLSKISFESMNNMSIGLLTLFTPLFILIYDKPKITQNENFADLDKSLILNRIIGAKTILWEIGLILAPTLFWNIMNNSMKWLLVLFWCIGIIRVVKKIIKMYQWISGNQFVERFAYLGTIIQSGVNLERTEIFWKEVWNINNINTANETTFVNLFFKLIECCINKKNFRLLSKLINDFQIFINNRSLWVLMIVQDGIFIKILTLYEKILSIRYNKDKSVFVDMSDIQNTLESIIESIMVRSLQNDQEYAFFETIRDHIDGYKELAVGDCSYKELFMNYFFSIFFKNMEKYKNRYQIWKHEISSEWLVTIRNIEDDKNKFSKILFNRFIEWCLPIISEDSEKIDIILEETAREVFPETDPIFWSIVLILVIRDFSNDNIMESLVKKQRNFGFIGRTTSYSFDANDDIDAIDQKMVDYWKEQEKYTAKLSIILFPYELSNENIQSYISRINQIQCDDAKQEKKKKQIKNYLILIEEAWRLKSNA